VAPWAGIPVSPTFRRRWLSGQHVGAAKPECYMELRRGHFKRRYHTFSEAGVVGKHGRVAHSTKLWYPDWTPTTDWETVVGLKHVRLEQSFDNKGVTAATIDIDNTIFMPHGSGTGLYHTVERGFYSPLRGYVYPGSFLVSQRPATPLQQKNENFMKLPNAQVRIWMGYGDAVEMVFTGLIDDIDIGSTSQGLQLIARDFGGGLVDQNVYGWAKDRDADQPVTFMPRDMHEEVTYVGGAPRASSTEKPTHPSAVISQNRNDPWHSGITTDEDGLEWIEIHVPNGRYRSIYVVGDYDDQEVHVGIYCRPYHNGKIRGKDRYHSCSWHPDDTDEVTYIREHHLEPLDGWVQGVEDDRQVPFGWLNLNHAAHMMPAATRMGYDADGDEDGTPKDRPWPRFVGPIKVSKKGKRVNIDFGGHIDLGPNSVIRVGIKPLTYVGRFHGEFHRKKYQAGIRALQARRKHEWDASIKPKENHIPVGDVSEIAETIFRWMGFKEWEVETVGTDLKHNYVVNKDKTFMDILDDLQTQTGYVFFMAEPSDNAEASIGRPIFRQNRIFEQVLNHQEQITGRDLLEDMKVKFTNKDERTHIRVAGKALSKKHGGWKMSEDTLYRAYYSYIPPWARDYRMAGLIKQFTYFNKDLETIDQCHMACFYIALQICLQSVTAIADLPGTPGVSLDSYISIVDEQSGTNSRLYVSNRTQEFTLGGDDVAYTLELGGSLPDTPDVKALQDDFWRWVTTIDPNKGPHKKRKKKKPHKHPRPPRHVGLPQGQGQATGRGQGRGELED
jgi:hypothetical protein